MVYNGDWMDFLDFDLVCSTCFAYHQSLTSLPGVTFLTNLFLPLPPRALSFPTLSALPCPVLLPFPVDPQNVVVPAGSINLSSNNWQSFVRLDEYVTWYEHEPNHGVRCLLLICSM